MKKTVAISLGGSQIIPDEINVSFLKKFKKIILKHSKDYNFVIITGGGNIARKYISSLKNVGVSEKLQNFAGISATRMNARFMSYFFNIDQKYGIPQKIKTLEEYLKKKDIVFCGALEYKPQQTSDTTTAQVAEYFNAEFINITDVDGLFNKNPKKHKDAKLISEISWDDFYKKTKALTFKPGQHFVIDKKSASIIRKNKIRTSIIGNDLRNLDKKLSGKSFKGTVIYG